MSAMEDDFVSLKVEPPSYAETQVVAAVLGDLTGQKLAQCRHLPPEAFTDAVCRGLWENVRSLKPGLPPGMALVGSGLDEEGLRRVSETEFSSLTFPGHLATVTASWIHRRTKAAAAAYQRGQIALPALVKELTDASASAASRAEQLAALRFNPLVDPPEQRVIYRLGKIPICTAGNLSCITAEAKAGKTSWLGAMIAAVMTTGGGDCFTLSAHNPEGRALLHFDTETSRADWHSNLCKAKRRAKVDSFPPWLQSYHLTGRTPAECRRDVEDAMALAEREFGGVFAVFIDGIGDLVLDPNDPDECFPLVMWLHASAIRYDTAIVNILHRNPGTEKSRGHLGSQLERKCETNLTLEKNKDDQSTLVFSLRQRGPAIPPADGPRFVWSDAEGMHVSAESKGAKKDREKSEQYLDAVSVMFSDVMTLRYAAIIAAIGKHFECADRKANAILSEMRAMGILQRAPGAFYTPTSSRV